MFFLPEKKDLGDPIAYVWGRLAYLNGHQTADTVQFTRLRRSCLATDSTGLTNHLPLLETDYEDCPAK